jgi:succinoglycan biosynthesis protein ExoO/succinoglycan biosynthesis protein ExoU
MVDVSIIIPAYNATATINRAVASALAQTDRDLEVLVVDDASTDATASVVARIARQDNRVHLLTSAVNCGPAAARNRGIGQAQGDWIAVLDADDEFLQHRLAELRRSGEQQRADVVADNLLLCPVNCAQAVRPMLPTSLLGAPRWMTAAEFVAGNVGSRLNPRVSYGFMQPIIRRSFLAAHGIRYKESNRFGEDFLLYLDCLMHGARWWLTPEPMYRYNVRFGSLTDVQSANDLLRISLTEERLLREHPAVRFDPDLAAALRRHKAVIDHFYHYRTFVDAAKARLHGTALRLLLQSPAGFRDIVREALMQAPRVAMKTVRGGYRGTHSPAHS